MKYNYLIVDSGLFGSIFAYEAKWEYINQFAEFNRYTNSPVARYKDEVYNLPFNMDTFNKLWRVFTPEEAKQKIEEALKCVRDELNG